MAVAGAVVGVAAAAGAHADRTITAIVARATNVKKRFFMGLSP
jgi:hypothetical protein